MRSGDAEVEAFLVGLTEEFSLDEKRRTAFRISASAGWIDFDSDAAGGDEDLGLMGSLRPEWKFYLSRKVRLNAGGDLDVLRTDFNQRHHHTRYDFSVLLSIELAF